MISAAATRPTELLPLRVRLRGVRTIDEEQKEQIINKADRSTYPAKKSVLRTEAAPLPVQVTRPDANANAVPVDGYVEILLGGATIRAHGRIDAQMLRTVLDCVAARA